MANPVVPNNMGGNRQFLADPENASLATVVGDLAAMNLQLMHALDEIIPGDADGNPRLITNALTLRARQLLAASNVIQQREQSTRELTPLTRPPADPYGATENIANIRMNNIPIFTGTQSKYWLKYAL